MKSSEQRRPTSVSLPGGILNWTFRIRALGDIWPGNSKNCGHDRVSVNVSGDLLGVAEALDIT